jgi:dihydroorotate dehydrogenase
VKTYRVDRSYDWNYENGPVLEGPLAAIPPTARVSFLGYEVASRLGIAAGLLLNARWIAAYARLGFDILTYKTVRSRYRACYPVPNWVYLPSAVPIADPAAPLVAAMDEAEKPPFPTSSVSFGMPSKDPEEWMEDVGRARRALASGQILVVSVVASPHPGTGAAALIDDFARLTAMAREAGAHVVEANLSCPNVTSAEGQIFQDPELCTAIASAMRENAGGVSVLLKAGYFAEDDALGAYLRAVAGHVSGVTLVNGLSRHIVDAAGRPAFGPGRESSGVLGAGVFPFCLDVVQRATAIVRRERLDLAVVAVGGVAGIAEAEAYFAAGAAAVTMGSAPMFDPLLAIRMKEHRAEW